jgi:PelA/Pel-15E family pectate lyase
MGKFTIHLFYLSIVFLTGVTGLNGQDIKPRVIVMTDGEIDDRSSMVRFLLYTNDIELLAVIETNSVYQREGHSKDDWYEKQLDAYEKVYPNLIRHDPNYPTAEEIRRKSFVGDENPDHLVVDNRSPLRFPGSEVRIQPDDWPDTPGSDRIVEILLDNDPRPVYIQAWGGGNTAARAFYKLKTQYPNDYDRAVSKAVMYNIWYQDGAGNYIEKYHPKVTMLLSHYFSGTWDYNSQTLTHSFIENEVKNNHGPLGALYPQSYVSEGDTPAFLWALDNGLRNHEDPTYGGWGGLFYKVDGFENVYADVSRGSYWKWIEAANRDFQARMDWCVAEKYEDANHKPIIKINGGLDRTVRSGETVELYADVSDPDGDRVNFRWWQYKEAGTFDKMVKIENRFSAKTSFIAPKVEKPVTVHIIAEATDRGTPRLTAYQRLIFTVVPDGWVNNWGVALNQKGEWYAGTEAKRIADNVLFYQRENGGWFKNINMAVHLSDKEKEEFHSMAKREGTTIDNGATHSQMTYLARVYSATGMEKFRDGFIRGLDYLLRAQYKNGGWPQYYPIRRGYYEHITFNDGAMIEVMRVLRDVAEGKYPFEFVDKKTRKQADQSVKKAVEVVLKTQINVNGELTGWCGQYDKETLKPAKARAYELPSICGSETAGIVQFLMEMDNPSRDVVRAITSAVSWLEKVKITGIRVDRIDDPSLHRGFDRVVVEDPSAPPLWARFYEIGTNLPIFVGRDSIIRYNFSEIEHERRVGYSYYVSRPRSVLDTEYPRWKQKLAIR